MDKLLDDHYHITDKGCIVIDKPILSREFKKRRFAKKMNTKYCIVHNKLICRCGWEFGHHPEF